MIEIELLDLVMKCAKHFVEHLASYYEDRRILMIKNLDEWKKKNFEYWM